MRGIIIARVSKGEQVGEGHHSIPVQLKELEEYAEKKGIEIVEKFIIGGESAYKGARRKFMKALNKAESIIRTEPIAVLFYDYDRFSRDVSSDTMRKSEDLRQAGVEFHFFSDRKVMHKKSSGRDLVSWKEEVLRAERESAIKGDKIQASINYKLSQNEYPGFTPTGYLQPFREDGKKVITIDPKRAPLILELFELYATGNYSMADLTKMMRSYGLTIKPKGKREARAVKKGDIQQMLSCKTYTGWFIWAGVEYKGSNYEAIITRELWEKVQKMLSERAIKYASKHTSTAKFYKYRGLLKCGYCGQTLTPTDMSDNYKDKKPGELIYYRCTYSKKNVDPDWYKIEFGKKHSGVVMWKGKKVYNCPQKFCTEEDIDQEVKRYLKRLAYDKSVIQKIKEKIGAEFKERMSATTLQKKSVEAEVSKRKKIIEGLIDKLAMSDLADIAEDIQNRVKVIKSEVEGLKAQLNTIDEFGEGDINQVVEALSLTSDLYKKYDKLSDMDKRRVVMSAFRELPNEEGEGAKGARMLVKKGWVGSEKNQEEIFNTRWSEPFHELWFKWVKNHVDVETLGRELEYEEWINSLDEKYLEDTEEVDQKDMSTEEHLIKMKDSI